MRRNHFRSVFILSLLLFDAGGLILAFQAAYWTRFSSTIFLSFFPVTKGVPELATYHQTLWALLPMCLLMFFYLGFYRETFLSAYDEFILVLKGAILCSLLTTGMSFAYRGIEYSRLVIGLWCLYSTVLLYGLRELDKSLSRRIMFAKSGPQHVLVLGTGRAAQAIREMAQNQPFVRTSFMESVPRGQSLEQVLRDQKVSELMLIQGALPSHDILEAARVCELLDLECKIVPDLLEMRRGEIIVNGFYGLPTFHIKPLSLHGTNYVLKRSFDIFVSLVILGLIFIPLALIGFLIRLETPGPALYTQDRVGLKGRKFKLFKFRTMVADADSRIENLKHLSERAGPVFKMKDDPRVTKLGRWLRRFSLDELPQILNVLKGDMSLVGPRPQVLWEAAHYDDTAKKRLRIMPGITGLWQVSGRAALSYEEMIDLDIFYLENWSLGLDLKILIRTLPAVFSHEGAY